MQITRDRIALIKGAHARLLLGKKQRTKKSTVKPKQEKAAKIQKSPEEIKEYNRMKDKKFRNSRKSSGLCRDCPDEAVLATYTHKGEVILAKRAQKCPAHWLNQNVKKEFILGGVI